MSHHACNRKRLGAALGVMALAAAGAGGAGAALAAGPPADAPQITQETANWEGKLVGAQDRPECLGRYTDTSSSLSIDTFKESKETWSLETWGNDPRFNTENVMVYLHILRDTTIGLNYDSGAVDGSYAVFNEDGLALAQGKIQGVLRNDTSVYDPFADNTALLNGLFYDGQVLQPSGATIGRPHLVANFTSSFTVDNSSASEPGEVNWYGGYGGTDSDTNGNNARPAVAIGGGCTGNYATRVQIESAAHRLFISRIKPKALVRELAYVKGLYNSTH